MTSSDQFRHAITRLPCERLLRYLYFERFWFRQQIPGNHLDLAWTEDQRIEILHDVVPPSPHATVASPLPIDLQRAILDQLNDRRITSADRTHKREESGAGKSERASSFECRLGRSDADSGGQIEHVERRNGSCRRSLEQLAQCIAGDKHGFKFVDEVRNCGVVCTDSDHSENTKTERPRVDDTSQTRARGPITYDFGAHSDRAGWSYPAKQLSRSCGLKGGAQRSVQNCYDKRMTEGIVSYAPQF